MTSEHWNKTCEWINQRRARRDKVLSAAISNLQGIYPHLNMGRMITVNNRTYHVIIVENWNKPHQTDTVDQ